MLDKKIQIDHLKTKRRWCKFDGGIFRENRQFKLQM